MKFFSWLLTILIIAIIIAAFTTTSDEKFTRFINESKDADTMSCKPIISHTSQIKVLVKIASIHRVSYCKAGTNPLKKLPVTLVKPDGSQDTVSKTGKTNFAPAKITGTETYLGLFGRFWKI